MPESQCPVQGEVLNRGWQGFGGPGWDEVEGGIPPSEQTQSFLWPLEPERVDADGDPEHSYLWQVLQWTAPLPSTLREIWGVEPTRQRMPAPDEKI